MVELPKIADFEDPIVRRSVAEQVAQRILGLVKAGSLKPGDQLPPERDLAASFVHPTAPSTTSSGGAAATHF
jgi:DNA-binding transcriptional regulator YhcF (GntR family)